MINSPMISPIGSPMRPLLVDRWDPSIVFLFDARRGINDLRGSKLTATGAAAIADVSEKKYLSMDVGDTCTSPTPAAVTSILTGGGNLTIIVRMIFGFAYDSIPAAGGSNALFGFENNAFRSIHYQRNADTHGYLRLNDGTTTPIVLLDWAANTPYDIACRVHTAGTKFQLGRAPVSTETFTFGTSQNYDGALGADGTTRVALSIAGTLKFAHIAVIGRDLGQAGIAAYCAALS